MIRVECATYGAAGGAHGLLASSIPRERLPADLAGMVDKPQYHPDGALPLLACAPMAPFFAVWRTLEDPGAARAGMVRSYVALVELAVISDLRNLAEVTARIPSQLLDDQFSSPFDIEGIEPPQSSPGPRYDGLCESLVAADRKLPVIVPDEGDWEMLLTTLWSFLWPEARRNLTCLHASGPEAIPATDPTILVTLRSAVNKWAGYPVVEHLPARTDAAKFLRGARSQAMAQLRLDLGALPADPRMVGLLERAAALLKLQLSGTAGVLDLKTLLEAVARLAPGAHEARSLKDRLVDSLATVVTAHARLVDVLSLSNLDLASHGVHTSSLEGAVRSWVARWLIRAEAHDVVKILRRAGDERFVGWWRRAVREGLRAVFATGDLASWEAAWAWAVLRPEALADLQRELLLDGAVELVVARACPRSLSAELATAGIALATAQNWPRVHAAVVAGAFAPREALERQLRFPERGRDGLGLLLERLDGPQLVELSLSFEEEELRRRAANAIVAAPGLLAGLDATNTAWLDLWSGALAAGLSVWAGIRDRTRVSEVVLDAVSSGAAIDEGILLSMASDLPLLPRGVPQAFWLRASPRVRNAYARAIGIRWLASLADPAATRPAPELFPTMLEVFAEQLAARSFRMDLLSRALDLSGNSGFLKRFIDGPVTGVPPAVARELGLRVQRAGDKELASAAFAQWDKGRRELEPFLIECSSLL
ncbi:MAG: hypothetical protein ACRENE_17045, partial [Polyangiaceae bacterium]